MWVLLAEQCCGIPTREASQPNLLTFDKAFKVFKEFNVLLVLQCSAELY